MSKDKTNKNKVIENKKTNSFYPFSEKSNIETTLPSQKSSNTITAEKDAEFDFNQNFFKNVSEPKSKSQPTINDYFNY